jgi:selenocysteine lyase/cysteine desulfurase
VADPALLEEIKNDKLRPSTMQVPERFEFGTLPYELMAGVTAAIDYIAGLDESSVGSRRERIVNSMKALERYEESLFEYLESQLSTLPGITLYGRAEKRTPTLYFNFPNIPGKTIYEFLATKKINAPASNFYAYEISLALGLGDAGAVRTGLAPYSTRDDVDRLYQALSEFLKG